MYVTIYCKCENEFLHTIYKTMFWLYLTNSDQKEIDYLKKNKTSKIICGHLKSLFGYAANIWYFLEPKCDESKMTLGIWKIKIIN